MALLEINEKNVEKINDLQDFNEVDKMFKEFPPSIHTQCFILSTK